MKRGSNIKTSNLSPRFDCPEIKALAKKYIWWKTPEEALRFPEKLVAQIMNMGDFDDVALMIRFVGEDYLRHVINHAEVGMFSPKSWHYWHYRLRLADEVSQVPPIPRRRIA